jgi:dolichol-phosphate mannosyltransferase
MKTDVVEYDRDKRLAGKTNYNFKSLIRCALHGLTGISIEPLRKIFWTFSVSLLAVIGSVIGLILSNGIWQSTFLIILIMSLFFSLLYISVALIAEYIAQIMLEVKHRPTSIIYEYEPSKNSGK